MFERPPNGFFVRDLILFNHLRRGGYVAIVVLLALVGGVALGTLAGARRTQTSYPTYLASTNPADLEVFDAFVNPALGFTEGYNPSTGQRRAASAASTRPRIE